jgi:adenylosuccinate lyase
MAGRTHGQAALAITFGFKVSVWLRENRRHIERLKEVRKRLGMGQLAGAVGSLATFGAKGLPLQERFCSSLGLIPPDIAWITARDVQTELLALFAMIATSFDKIGHEVYSLQRSEIGELRERPLAGAVGSITMPHKQNPEVAEHLGTLARIIRHESASLLESLVHDHERDGRSWKVEWGTIGPSCVMMGALLKNARALLDGLQVNANRMRSNLEATRGFLQSERVLIALAEKTGRYTAHSLVAEASNYAVEHDLDLEDAVLGHQAIGKFLTPEAIRPLFAEYDVGTCGQFVDRAVSLTRRERETDPPADLPDAPRPRTQ